MDLKKQNILNEIDRLGKLFSTDTIEGKFALVGHTQNTSGILFYTKKEFPAQLLKKQLLLLHEDNEVAIEKISNGINEYLENNRKRLSDLVISGY
jgi:hypothetical protein